MPALVATQLVGHGVGVLAGAAAMLGHYRPIFLRFRKGGKMVATAGGAFLGVAPLVGGLGAGVWLVVFRADRYASVASIVVRASLPLWAWLLGYPWPVIAFGASPRSAWSSCTARTSGGWCAARRTASTLWRRWSAEAR